MSRESDEVSEARFWEQFAPEAETGEPNIFSEKIIIVDAGPIDLNDRPF